MSFGEPLFEEIVRTEVEVFNDSSYRYQVALQMLEPRLFRVLIKYLMELELPFEFESPWSSSRNSD